MLGAAFWAAVQTRVAERLRMRTHSRPAGVSHVRPTMRPADQRATSGCGRPPGPRRVRARVLRRATLGCLAPVARMLACVIVALSVTHRVCAEDLARGASHTLASAASLTRVEAAGEHEACQCERCGLCRWYQLPCATPGNATALPSPPDALLRTALADQDVAVGAASEQPARAPPVPVHS